MNPFFHFAPLFTQTFIWLPTRLMLEWFGRIKIEGKENLKGIKHNVIFAMNHSSEIDPFIIPASLPIFSRFLPLFFATKGKGFYSNFWGGHTVLSSNYDYKVSLKNHMRLADAKESFVAFLPQHAWAAFLSDYAQCPIIPVAVSGISEMKWQDFFDRKTKIVVKFGRPIFQSELKGIIDQNHPVGENIYKKQTEYVMGKIEEMGGK